MTTPAQSAFNALVEEHRKAGSANPFMAAVKADPATYNRMRLEQAALECAMQKQSADFRADQKFTPAEVFQMAKDKPAAYSQARRDGLV